jgi:hypothetical protein
VKREAQHQSPDEPHPDLGAMEELFAQSGGQVTTSGAKWPIWPIFLGQAAHLAGRRGRFGKARPGRSRALHRYDGYLAEDDGLFEAGRASCN